MGASPWASTRSETRPLGEASPVTETTETTDATASVTAVTHLPTVGSTVSPFERDRVI